MRSDDVIKYIRLAIPDTNVNADDTARAIFNKAVTFVGRMPNVDFNRDWVTFNFVSGTKTYEIGKDILAELSDVMRATVLTATDNVQPVEMISIESFRTVTSGLTASGRPTHATVHSSSKKLEVYPTPDSSYEYGLYAQHAITKFEDIPSAYHDVVGDVGIAMVAALKDPSIALSIAKAGLDAMKFDSIIGWSGTNVSVGRGLSGGSKNRATSYNLMGD